ncbi:hypothetical protein CCHR01_02411 [Colletotrichum chrysophilum]|nr:hypothetical protein CCHR01_02411 [Colletotrichum chrysophilum]
MAGSYGARIVYRLYSGSIHSIQSISSFPRSAAGGFEIDRYFTEGNDPTIVNSNTT